MAKRKEEKQNIEDMFESLDGIIEELEDPDISLEDSFTQYKNGMELIKKCKDALLDVEKKVLVLNEGGELDEL